MEQKQGKGTRQRTIAQNNALHLWFTQVAEALNLSGQDMRVILKPEIEIPWSAETVKEYLWRPIQRIQLQKESTVDMTIKEIDEVLQVLTVHLARIGIDPIPFPDLKSKVLNLK